MRPSVPLAHFKPISAIICVRAHLGCVLVLLMLCPVCLQAFDLLLSMQLLSAGEEATLLVTLPFQPADSMIRELYAVRLGKVSTF